jgi:hypothetical protein
VKRFKDPAVVKELDEFISELTGVLGVSLNEDGSLKLATPSGGSTTVNSTSITDTIEQEEGHWWKKGPWIFDTPSSHNAIIVTPQLQGTINDMAPGGIDTAIGVEFNLSAALTITGIKAPPGAYRRIVVLRNNSSTYQITLKQQDTGSQDINRFALPDDTDIVIGKHETVWLYYDADNHRWGTFVTSNTAGGISKGVILEKFVDTDDVALAAMSNTGYIDVVPAPGAGKILIPVFWNIEKNSTTAFGMGSGNAINLQWGVSAFDGFNWGQLNADLTTGNRAALTGQPTTALSTTAYGTRDPRNKPLSIHGNTAITSGAGTVTLRVTVMYYTINSIV